MPPKKKDKNQVSKASAKKRQTTLKFPSSSTTGGGDGGKASSSATRDSKVAAIASGSAGKTTNRNVAGSAKTPSHVRHAKDTAKIDSKEDGGPASFNVDRAKTSAATTKTAGAGGKTAAPIARTLPSPAAVVDGNKRVHGKTDPEKTPSFAVVINVSKKTKSELNEFAEVDEGGYGDSEDNTDEDGDRDEDDEPVRRSSRKRVRREAPSGGSGKGGAGSRVKDNKQKPTVESQNGDDEMVASSDDESIITPAARKRQKPTPTPPSTLRKGKKKVVESEDSDLELPITKKKKISLDDDEESEPTLKKNVTSLEDDKSDLPPRKRKSLVRGLSKNDESDPELPTPKKMVLLDDDESDSKLPRIPGKSSLSEESSSDHEPPTQDEEDIKEDMELAAENAILDRRERKGGSSKKMSFRQRMAHLRAKRDRKAGITSSQAVRSSTPSASAPSSGGDGDGSDSTSGDEDLDSFVVEDDPDDLIGAPDVQIPLEFTSAAHESDSEQFRLYVEFLIHDVLFPNTVTKGEVETNAVRRLETAAASFGNSVIQSGAWTASFARALKARPNLVTGECEKADHCDACNRNNQHCTLTVQFLGHRYNKDTLCDLSSGEEEESTDEHGEELFPEDKIFQLGKMCYTRARSAHTLFHWKKELKGWVEKHLESTGYIDEDGDLVDQSIGDTPIEDQMEYVKKVIHKCRKDIKDLYGDFKRTVKQARESMEAKKWRGGDKAGTFI